MNIFEACVGNYNEAVRAERLGADRIELCDNLMEDGTTPSFGTIKACVKNLKIPTMVIIRPRGGNFVYSEEEIEIIKADIEICKELGAYGVVVGVLDKNNNIDIKVIQELVHIAKPMNIAFHMAFDEVGDKFKAVDELVELGFDRILTRGGVNNAMEGKDMLKKLVKYAGNRIIIMPGKGVNTENRDYILEYTGATEIHGTKVV